MSQTNFLVVNLTKTFSFSFFKEKRVVFAFFVMLLCTLFISSCSTKSTIRKTVSQSEEVLPSQPEAITAEKKLALAQSLYAQSADDNDTLLAQQSSINSLLIEASQLFVQQQNYTKALWLANEITHTLQDKNLLNEQHQILSTESSNEQNTNQSNYRLLLVKAHSLQALNYPSQAQQQLDLAKELVSYTNNNRTTSSLALTLDYYLILNKVLLSQGHSLPALSAQLNALALNPEATNDDIKNIWHQLETLTQWQLAHLINNKDPFIKGWAQLVNYSHKFGANPEQYSRYLNLWQQHYPAHPAMAIVPQLYPEHLPESTDVRPVENIAILLPLTGNQKKAGLAAQQGILAAYNTSTYRNLFFIDTNLIDWQNLATRIDKFNISHIIGPLLKSNVETFLALSTQQPALQIPTLLLNLSSQHELAIYQTALSMRPEDEAIQAAATLSQHNYTKPIILSHNDRVSKRIAIAYRDQWQSSTGNNVDIVYFDQGQQMQASLKESLDVNTSESRIKQLNSRLKHNIEAEPRNRRDIDMIYLVGTSAQTRLIKPYIDVNISPFADIIPVYASSRSHSDFNDKNTSSSMTDLQGLTFTQIPWLLDSKQQDKVLNKLSNDLWPKRTDSLSRIFAMGFDSYHLLDKISLMRKYSYIRHFGQTGVLQLTNENIITRSLLWGQYKNDKVIHVAME